MVWARHIPQKGWARQLAEWSRRDRFMDDPVAADPPWLRTARQLGLPLTLRYPSTTLARLLDQTADRYGDATFLIYQGQRSTYHDVLQRVNRTAAGLAMLGVRAGDRVIVTLPNCPEWIDCFFGVQKLGAVAVTAGPLMAEHDLEAIAQTASPRAIIGLDLQAPTLHRVAEKSGVGSVVVVSLRSYQPLLQQVGYQLKRWKQHDGSPASVRTLGFVDLLQMSASRPPTVVPSSDDLAVLQPTSGTTGTPKLTQLTHRNLLANVTQASALVPPRVAIDRVLAVLPLFHVYGLTACLLTSVFHGAELLLITRFKAAELLRTIAQEKPTILPLVPMILERLCEAIEQRHRAAGFEHVRCVISGAAPLSPDLAHRFEQLTRSRIDQGYGLTEASPVTHGTPVGHGLPGSIGLPLPDTRVRIVDLDDPMRSRDAPPGQPGELLISGPQVSSGYYHDDEQTRQTFSVDAAGRRWLHTGDVVTFDERGYFYIIDRRKDIINHGGFKVSPAKVEQVLRENAQVQQVAVVGRPDAMQTEIVVAVIKLAQPVKDHIAVADELRSLCRQRLAKYEVPEVFEFVDELPVSPLGKLLRRELRRTLPAQSTPPIEHIQPLRQEGET